MAQIIAVSGASGSGKTTFAKALLSFYEGKGLRIGYISADSFFKKELPVMVSPADGCRYPDWNHPTSIDSEAFVAAVMDASENGEYDYVITEGVNIFCYEELRDISDVKIFIDASPEMRIFRRISRNTVLMGQTVEYIGEYYLKCARYREAEFSLASSVYADIHVENEWGFDVEKESLRIAEYLG